MLENVGVPLEIVDGFISSISVAVPWTSLLSESCQIEVSGMELTFAPKHKVDPWNHGEKNELQSVSWSLFCQVVFLFYLFFFAYLSRLFLLASLRMTDGM